MAKTKDLSPKLPYSLPPAEVELAVPVTQQSMGERIGGLSMYSNTFKRGYGDAVFGSSEEGIWLGAADFEDAPFAVDMEGNVIATSLNLSQYLTKTGTGQALTGSVNVGNSNVLIDGVNNRIVINDGTTNRIVIGNV